MAFRYVQREFSDAVKQIERRDVQPLTGDRVQ